MVSPKKRTNEFGFFSYRRFASRNAVWVLKTNSFVRFLGESKDTNKSFWKKLTFSKKKVHSFSKHCYSQSSIGTIFVVPSADVSRGYLENQLTTTKWCLLKIVQNTVLKTNALKGLLHFWFDLFQTLRVELSNSYLFLKELRVRKNALQFLTFSSWCDMQHARPLIGLFSPS